MKNCYASLNGLNMYYEIHGNGKPLILLHGALSAIEIDFGKIIPLFAKNRKVIAIEQQAHGHTADIDRPLIYDQMVDDTIALLKYLKIEKADIFGYSFGAGIAMQIAIQHPELVNRLVLASVSYNKKGFHHEVIEGVVDLKPEYLDGSPFKEVHDRIAPNPEDWTTLIEKVNLLNKEIIDLSPETIHMIRAPTLVIIGDSDIIRPEHAVEIFRLLGGGVPGDITGLPNSQLAVLPGTTHITLIGRVDWLFSMISEFLDVTNSKNQK
jgi:pimeloyl-ACP methyl ester carboxylesterase